MNDPTKPNIYLKWSDLNVEVTTTNSKTKLPEKKIILNKVSGHVKPGEMMAIMGPSGAGKTTLLAMICKRMNRSKGVYFSGNVNFCMI